MLVMVLLLRVAKLASRTPRIIQKPCPSILHQVGSYRTDIMMLVGLDHVFRTDYFLSQGNIRINRYDRGKISANRGFNLTYPPTH